MTNSRNPFLVVLLWLVLTAIAHAQVTYVYTDEQGSPLAEADASGNITSTYDYRPFGGVAMGSAPDGIGYTGHVDDPDTAFVYMQARYYDPALGRFISTDPSSAVAQDLFGFNRYVYTNNNPINNTDPDGQDAMANPDTPPPAPPSVQNPAPPKTLATVLVAAQAPRSFIYFLGSRAVYVTGVVTLGVTLFVVDSNSINDMVNGRKGCYGDLSCVGATVQISSGKKIPKPGVSGKDGAKDVPSWAKGERPNIGESGKDFADRLYGGKYGEPPTDRGPGSEWSKIKKWGDRAFVDP